MIEDDASNGLPKVMTEPPSKLTGEDDASNNRCNLTGVGEATAGPANKLRRIDSRNKNDVPVEQPEGQLSYTIIVNDKLLQHAEQPTKIKSATDFTVFIGALRDILAGHLDPEDICDRHEDTNISSSTHPLLPKTRADQQPARWIQVKLQEVVEEGDKSTASSTTLVMRDDNVDVMGFSNDKGQWYELGHWRMLPPKYKSELQRWGNSYKSILAVESEEEVIEKLKSAKLGKNFAMDAVQVLSRFPDEEAGSKISARLAVVGLVFMVCESAKLNHVQEAIADGWDGRRTEITDDLMTGFVWKYVDMSRRLRHWKEKRYGEPIPVAELSATYLVLNEEYTTVDVGRSYPGMSKAVVTVKMRLKGEQSPLPVVSSKVSTLIGGVRVGCTKIFEDKKGMNFNSAEGTTHYKLASYEVAVPCGREPYLEVDLLIKAAHDQQVSILEILKFANKTWRHQVEGHQIEVDIEWNRAAKFECISTSSPQPRPVEVKMGSDNITVEYTIGDRMSFTEFIMVLRRVVADHPDREDILDRHPHFLSLSCTREHPLLARVRPIEPFMWVHIKLQVKEPEKDKQLWPSTTLLVRTDTMYVCGFENQNGHRYRLTDGTDNGVYSLPIINENTTDLQWGVTYGSLFSVQNGELYKDQIMDKVRDKKLGYDFAVKGVKTLSSFRRHPPNEPADDATMEEAKIALGCLTMMVCESARMNTVHDAIASRWKTGKLTSADTAVMKNNVWDFYGKTSSALKNWKMQKYKDLELEKLIEHLKVIHLVQNSDLKPSNSGKGRGRGGGGGGGKGGDGSNGGKGGGRGGGGGKGIDDSHTINRQDGVSTSGGGDAHTTASNTEGDGDIEDTKKHNEVHNDTQGNGRPLIELLSLRADLGEIGRTIAVFDGKRGQIIYREGIQEVKKGEMVDLVLTGPYTRISAAYGCFAIRIDMPQPGTTPIKWEWDCNDPEYADQIDGGPKTHTIDNPANHQKVAEVTYAVMSNARQATVQVLLRPKDGASGGGIIIDEITAVIKDFKDGEKIEDKHKSVLFRRASREKGQAFPTTKDNSWYLVPLARNVVAVPCSSALDIEVKLQIQTDDSKQVPLNVPLSFTNGICWSKTGNCKEVQVQVEVNWYPEIPRPEETREEIDQPELKLPAEVKMATEVVYTIGDEQSFTEFIADIRRILADHPDREDLLDERPKFSSLSSNDKHPVLAKQRAEQPARWIHVKLQAVKGEEMLSTTLLMRADNMYVCGFMNHQGDSFELIDNPERSANMLPVDEYNPQRLSWGVGYRSLLDADTEDDLARMLSRASLGHHFAMKAVHVLSCFPAWADGNMNPRMALAGLIVMVCESARMKRISEFIELCWSNNKMKFTDDLMRDFVLNYGSMSRELLTWKSERYTTNPNPTLQKQHIYLVLNSRMYRYPPRYQGSSMDRDRPRVELLAMRADFEVVGTTITVFDGKQGHIIYRKDEQGEKGMVDLVLTGPYTGISAYGCFAIKIDIPSGAGDPGGSIKWEWDCYDPKYADEVDKPPEPRQISSGPGRNVWVTYVVMSDAQEATVQVKLRLKDGNSSCSVQGHITADSSTLGYPAVTLFRCETPKTAQSFSPTAHSDVLQLARSLKLARNVVAVRHGQMLRVQGSLLIQTSNEQGVISNNQHVIDVHLGSDDNGIFMSKHRNVYGGGAGTSASWYARPSRQMDEVPLREETKQQQSDEQVQVTAGWYPDLRHSKVPLPYIEEKRKRQPDIWYKVGQDEQGFSTFIAELRRLVGEHPRCKDLMADHPQRSSTHSHQPVLPRRPAHIRPEMLFHIKLEAVVEAADTLSSSVTLVMRYDNLDVIGFINQNEFCYELGKPDDRQLPSGYRPIILPWGKDYGTILNAGGLRQAEDIMAAAKLGIAFAVHAVHCLSRFEDVGPNDRAKRLLVGLMIMICDSARMEPVHQAIAGGWNTEDGTVFSKEQRLKDCRRMWPAISGALLNWRDHAYQGWPQNRELERIGIKSPEDARQIATLVFNDEERICVY